jgi:hypothetical protein
MIVNWGWTRMPPVMQRTLADDIRAAVFVFAGAALAALVFGDAWLLVGSAIGLVVGIVVLNVVRRVRRSKA